VSSNIFDSCAVWPGDGSTKGLGHHVRPPRRHQSSGANVSNEKHLRLTECAIWTCVGTVLGRSDPGFRHDSVSKRPAGRSGPTRLQIRARRIE